MSLTNSRWMALILSHMNNKIYHFFLSLSTCIRKWPKKSILVCKNGLTKFTLWLGKLVTLEYLKKMALYFLHKLQEDMTALILCLVLWTQKPDNRSLQTVRAIPKCLHFTWQSMMTSSVRRENLGSNLGNKTSWEWNSDLPILPLERISPSSSKKRLRLATRKRTSLMKGFNSNNFSLSKYKLRRRFKLTSPLYLK